MRTVVFTGLSSNIISGIYDVLFEILLPILLGLFVRSCLSSWNVRCLFHKNQTIRLEGTRLAVFVDTGLSTRTASRVLATVGGLIVLLTIAGSPSINGVSRPATAIVTGHTVITNATSPDELIDFTKHVSEDGERASATYHLAMEAVKCRTLNSTLNVFNPSIGQIEDLTSVNVLRFNHVANNSKCWNEGDGFKAKVLTSSRVLKNETLFSECFVEQFDFTNSSSKMWRQNIVLRNCAANMTYVWCATYEHPYCIGPAISAEGHSVIYLLLRQGEQPLFLPEQPNTADMVVSDYAFHEKSIKSMAYLFSIPGPLMYTEYWVMVRSAVKQNVRIPKYVTDELVQSTEIDAILFSCTAGLALISTFAIALVAFFLWWQNVQMPGRKECNSLNSAEDAMRCAVANAFHKPDYQIPREGILVGVSRKRPHVGPIRAFDEEEGVENGPDDGMNSGFDEDFLEGPWVSLSKSR